MMDNNPQSSGPKKMIWPIISTVLVIIVAIAAILIIRGMNEDNNSSMPEADNQNQMDSQNTGDQGNVNVYDNANQATTTDNNVSDQNANTNAPATTDATTNVKSFTVTAANFSFDPKEIKVKKGDTVQITLKNAEGFHDWILDEFKANTGRLKAGETKTISFVADKVGTFEYYCSVGKHRQMGMKGNLIVE